MIKKLNGSKDDDSIPGSDLGSPALGPTIRGYAAFARTSGGAVKDPQETFRVSALGGKGTRRGGVGTKAGAPLPSGNQ